MKNDRKKNHFIYDVFVSLNKIYIQTIYTRTLQSLLNYFFIYFVWQIDYHKFILPLSFALDRYDNDIHWTFTIWILEFFFIFFGG